MQTYNEFSQLTPGKSWEEGVAECIELRIKRDKKSWDLGDKANELCEKRNGRPLDPTRTIARLAAEISEDRSVLSHLASNAEFYTPAMREKFPANASWRQASRARIASGWVPDGGLAPTGDQRRYAMALLRETVDNAGIPAAQRPMSATFVQWLVQVKRLKAKSKDEQLGAALDEARAAIERAEARARTIEESAKAKADSTRKVKANGR